MALTEAERHRSLRAELSKRGQSALCTLEASPGPWWMFNRVNTLAVSEERFWIASSGRATPLIVDYSLKWVQDVSSRRQPSWAAGHREPVTELRIRMGNGSTTFTVKDAEAAARFIEVLRGRLGRSA